MDGKELDRCCNVGKLVGLTGLFNSLANHKGETGDHMLQSVKLLIKNIHI